MSPADVLGEVTLDSSPVRAVRAGKGLLARVLGADVHSEVTLPSSPVCAVRAGKGGVFHDQQWQFLLK